MYEVNRGRGSREGTFGGTAREQGEEGFLFVALKRGVWTGCLHLAPGAGVHVSGYWVGSGHGSGWKLPPSLHKMQVGPQHKKPPKERENTDLDFRGAQQPLALLDAAGFLPPTPQKVCLGSFLRLVHILPFYSGASGLGFYSFLIAYSVKENEFSLQ